MSNNFQRNLIILHSIYKYILYVYHIILNKVYTYVYNVILNKMYYMNFHSFLLLCKICIIYNTLLLFNSFFMS